MNSKTQNPTHSQPLFLSPQTPFTGPIEGRGEPRAAGGLSRPPAAGAGDRPPGGALVHASGSSWLAMGQKPNRTPSDHPNPTTVD